MPLETLLLLCQDYPKADFSMIYQFAGNVLNIDRHVFSHGGNEVAVEPQVFDILSLLAENAGTLVTKDELIEAVWGGRIVSEATISARINAARVAVGDNGKDQKVIRTVPRRGFEMVADVVVSETQEPSPKTKPPARSIRQTIRYLTTEDGKSIAWSSAGEGPPLLFAWHQFSHLEMDWKNPFLEPSLQTLAQKFRVIRYDIRGSGLSDPISETDGVAEHAKDMLAVADAAGLISFPVIAVLQSTAFAICVAKLNPERISKLVLWSPYARGRAKREGAPPAVEHDPFFALLDSGGWGDPTNAFMRAWATMVLPGASYDETTEMILQIAHSGTTEAAIIQRRLIDNLDVTHDLSGVKCPVSILAPRLSAVHPVAEARRVAAGIPEAEFLELDSASTFLIPSDPEYGRMMETTLEFLSRV